MRNKFLFLCLFLFGTLTACKDTKWVDVPTGTPPEGAITGKPGEPEEPDDPTVKSFINCSYIRGDFFEINRISAASMGACTDLIYLAARPYANGEVAFELPLNDATMTNVSHTGTFQGRNGVVKFEGTSFMNGGDGLLHSADGAFNKFTFGTYIYISEWVDGAFLFKKMDGNSTIIAFQMGATANSLKLSIGSSVATVTTPDLATGWHYIGLTYEQGTAKLYVDTNNTAISFVGALPNEVPNTRTDFLIGDKFKGYLDETFVSSLVVGTSGRNPITFDNWNNSKILAYWKYDDATKPGKDSHSWLGRLNNIRTALQGQQGDRRLRLGIAGGEWKKMMADATARTRFASEVKKIIEQYDFDGVDFDFEWPTNTNEFNNYSATVIQMRSTLGKYGIPKNKLVMGVPFYGSTGSLIAAYYDFVNDGLATTIEDTYTYKGNTYTFNSVETIRKKARYVCEEGFAGIMSWDLATDIDVTNNKSLLKAIKEEFEYYANPTE